MTNGGNGLAALEEKGIAMKVPNISAAGAAFGAVDHLPAYHSLPDDFRRMRSPFCDAVSMWFFKGAKPAANGIDIDGVTYTAKEGIDASAALRAIGAALRSFAPKHEHKIAGCGYMLAQWFDRTEAAVTDTATPSNTGEHQAR